MALSGDVRRRTSRIVMTVALVVVTVMCMPTMRSALSVGEVDFDGSGVYVMHFADGGTATLHVNGKMTGTCRVSASVSGSNVSYSAVMPDGATIPLAMAMPAAARPASGTYSFTASPLGGNSWSVDVETEGATSVIGANGAVTSVTQPYWVSLLRGTWGGTAVPQVAWLSFRKTSSNPAVSEGGTYDLRNATFGVYLSANDARLDRNAVAKRVTAGDGAISEKIALEEGRYYVREISAPTGFAISDQVTEVVLGVGQSKEHSQSDMPLFSSSFSITKNDSMTARTLAQGDATLVGTRFRVEYFDAYLTSSTIGSRTPLRTWIVATDENVKALVDVAHKVAGSDLYMDGTSAVLPLGTYRISEETPPSGYRQNQASFVRQVTGVGVVAVN